MGGIMAPRDPCTMGVGCEEYGVCYAEAHGEPDRCPVPTEQEVQHVPDTQPPRAR